MGGITGHGRKYLINRLNEERPVALLLFILTNKRFSLGLDGEKKSYTV